MTSEYSGVEAAEALRLYPEHVSVVHHSTSLSEVLLNSVCPDGTCHGPCAGDDGECLAEEATVPIWVVGPGLEAKWCTTSGIHVSLSGHHDVHHG